MTAREFLSLYRAAEEKILSNRRQMILTERRAWEVCSRSYFEYSSKYEDKLWEENEQLAETMAEIEKAVEKLTDGNGKQLLRLRYIEGKKWSAISEEMCYSEQHLYRIHQKALNQIWVPLKYRKKTPE